MKKSFSKDTDFVEDKNNIISTSDDIIHKSENSNFEPLMSIMINGARENNLKNISLKIPRNKLVVVTGLSGSGKSSLAFDTLYAEGQRRYVNCLAPYARQFMGMLKKPKVDSIEGLSPAISIEQKTISHNPRSTVGTVTEIYDYLRLLYAKIGTQYCINCNIPVVQKTVDQIIEEIYKSYNNVKIQILTPLIRGRKGHYRELFEQLQKQGFTKVRVNGEVREIKDGMELSRYKIHNIELVVDRCIVNQSQEHRITESVELALHRGEGTMMILYEEKSNLWKEKLFSTEYSCPLCNTAYQPLSPNMFSFNSYYGACNNCQGLGIINEFDLSLLIRDRTISINNGAIIAIGSKRETWLWEQTTAFAKKNKIDLDIPVSEIPEEKLNILLYGTENNDINMDYKLSNNISFSYNYTFPGLIHTLKHQFNTTASSTVKASLELLMAKHECPECHGGRLKKENLAVKINNKSISHFIRLDIDHAYKEFKELEQSLTEREIKIANLVLKEIIARLNFLRNVGLSYLDLNRPINTLSGGESQRIMLASQIGSELVGILYVLDEPSIGLHQFDNDKLIDSLKNLRDMGNSVVVVEHDKAMMECSDFIVDIGPGAGIHGGEILFASEPQKVKKLDKSIIKISQTAQYITAKKEISIPTNRRIGNGGLITLFGAKGNNLKNIDLKIPLGRFICVSGLSGSGKSSLINDTLYPILSRHFYKSSLVPLKYDRIEGLELIDKIIEIDQSPIGRTPRSNPATYTGIFTQIRDFFAMLTESKIRGYKPGRFSFNIPGGRCEECEGAGIKKIEMNFLPNVYVTCDSCNGKRYNDETLTVLYKSRSIADVLDMTVEEGVEFFTEIPRIKSKLQTLFDVGLGYIKLGQQAPTLSGGEAQRVKLATELSKLSTGKTLYLLDEPTTGLHFEDIRILLKLLDKLVDKGNTVIVIEHNLDVIKYADWVIDLGPKGGADGGEIIAEGTPEMIANNKKSLTGKYLKKEMNL